MDDIRAYLSNPSNVGALLPEGVVVSAVLAAGGQGIVYRGSVDKTDSAVKVYFPGWQARVAREISALSVLKNPHIVRLLWSSTIKVGDDELPVMATELISGIDLATCLQNGPLTTDQIGRLIYDMAEAIDAMWAISIVHRDIKPPNILIRPDGRATLIDLGVARHLDRTPLTALGRTWGTLGYMSPEQTAAARLLTCKSDIFSLAVVGLESAIGRHPTHQDQLRLLAMGYHDRLPDEIATWKHAQLLQSMLYPRPTKRPMPKDICQTLAEYK